MTPERIEVMKIKAYKTFEKAYQKLSVVIQNKVDKQIELLSHRS
jgi:hypothetical protein